MIRRIEGLPSGVFGFEAGGRVTRDEVDDIMITFDATIGEDYDVALLFDFLPDLESDSAFKATAFDNRLAARGRTQRFAFIGHPRWRAAFEDFVTFVGGEARMFTPGQRDLAFAWLLKAPFLQGRNDTR